MRQVLDGARLDRKHSLRDQIYALVRKLILTGKIAPGEIIDEKTIAARLGISRTPVREAVKKLTDEHLVDVVAQSATRAALIDRREVEQAFLIRRALEMESAAQAALRMTQAHERILLGIVEFQVRAIKRRRVADAILHDDRFHRQISAISDLPRLWRAIEISKAQLDRCRHIMLLRQGEAEATLQQHRAIIRALTTGKPDRARTLMAQHLEAAYYSTLRAMDAGEIDVVGASLQVAPVQRNLSSPGLSRGAMAGRRAG
jgi:GntR family transcriptional regulator, rspAB operon transcriptional repressor